MSATQLQSHSGKALVLILAALGIPTAQATTFCMLAAETYYQQLYCEVTAGGGGGALPSFADFKRNNPTVQALLLKRPAKRLGIEVALPQSEKRKQIAVDPDAPLPSQAAAPERRAESSARTPVPDAARAALLSAGLAACRLQGAEIACGERRYELTGNRANRHLRAGALGEENRMNLPVFAGNLADAPSVGNYLYRAYQRYVEKMLDIGLGGATMNYGKFAFLFKDLSEKGVDFAGRFETMYRYLRKDKASIGVSGQVQPDQRLRLVDCGGLGERIIVCARSGRNYVYLHR